MAAAPAAVAQPWRIEDGTGNPKPIDVGATTDFDYALAIRVR